MTIRQLKELQRWKEHFAFIMPVPRLLRGPRLPTEKWVQEEMFYGFPFERKPTKFYHSRLEDFWRPIRK
jgi:hypothetical protein